jgi:hypothetical protein
MDGVKLSDVKILQEVAKSVLKCRRFMIFHCVSAEPPISELNTTSSVKFRQSTLFYIL